MRFNFDDKVQDYLIRSISFMLLILVTIMNAVLIAVIIYFICGLFK